MIFTKQKMKNALIRLFESGFNGTLDQKDELVENELLNLSSSYSGDYELPEGQIRVIFNEAFDRGFKGCLELKEEHAIEVVESLKKKKKPEKAYVDKAYIDFEKTTWVSSVDTGTSTLGDFGMYVTFYNTSNANILSS